MSEAPDREPHAPEGMVRRIVRETTRFAALQVVASVVVWVTTLLLTRLLDPRTFGAYSIGTFFLGLGALLGDGGLGATLLRKKTEIEVEELRNTLTFLLLLGATMAATFLVGMPFIERSWRLQPGEAAVLRLLAPLYLVGPLRVVPSLRMERAMDFGRIARVELAATLTRQLVAVLLAWRFGGVIALAGAQLSGSAVQLSLAWRSAPGWPGLSLDRGVLSRLLKYGIQVQALSVAAFFKDNLSAALLGTLLGPRAVGFFEFGVKYAQVPVQAVNALGRVQLPVYARLERADDALFQAIRGATRVALVLGVGLLVLLGVAAPAVIPTLYKPQWLASLPVVYGLAGNMAGGLLAGPFFVLLQGQGHAGTAIRVFTVWTGLTWALVAIVWKLGLGAVAGAYSVVTLGVVAWLIQWAERHLGRRLWDAYVGPMIAGLGATATAVALAWKLPTLTAWARAPLSLCAYVLFLTLLEGRSLRGEAAAWVRSVRGR
ncbi:MAG: oligosaccharide flippase family protein [Polyangiales bacterium]